MSVKASLGSVASLLAAALLFTSCTKSDVKKVLQDNPDIIFEILEKNPMKVAEVMEKVQVEARKMQQEKAEKDMKAQMDEEFKNPKTSEMSDSRAIRGKKGAPIEIIEFSDFQCPYCQRGFFTAEEVRKKYGDKVRFMFKHLPLDFHPMSMPAAKRFEAISLQNHEKAYQFHDEVFKNQQRLSEGEKFLDEAAKKTGVDMAKMKKDMDSDKVKEIIAKDMAEAKGLGISGTPGFLVAGITVRGAYPISYFDQIIERRLKDAKH